MTTPLENARFAVEHDPVRLWMESATAQEGRRWQKALRLSPNIEVMEALLRGEDVPKSKLDPHWAKAYGID